MAKKVNASNCVSAAKMALDSGMLAAMKQADKITGLERWAPGGFETIRV
jgi:hypothetical protein